MSTTSTHRLPPEFAARLTVQAANIQANAADCAVLVIGTDGCFHEVISGDPESIGLAGGQLRGERIDAHWPVEVAKALAQALRKCLRTRTPYLLDWQASESDPRRHLEIFLLANGRDRALMTVRDRTASSSLNAQVQQLAFRDPLTNLPNRAAVLTASAEMLDRARLRERPVAAMRISVMGFRFINQTFGRAAGNALLIETARRLSDCLQSVSAAEIELARTEGEEFTALIAGAGSSVALGQIADEICKQVDAPFQYEGNSLELGCSIGIAQFPRDGEDTETLLGNADIALREAMANGGNGRSFYSGTALNRCLSRLDLEQEMRWALENDHFDLEFQPCVDFTDHSVVSVEALLRWQHPLRGAVPLSEILPVAAMSGLGEALGRWVINSVCRALNSLPELGAPLSINVSTRHITSPGLAPFVAAVLAEHEVAAERLQFEFRAVEFFRNLDAAARTARALRKLGAAVVVDDLNADRCSLLGLCQARVSGIKLSRTLVTDITSSEETKRCSAALIAMARELGISVSATGVETEAQYHALKELGCKHFQGHLHARPLDLEGLRAKLAAQEPSGECNFDNNAALRCD